jgi:FtsH-binding integral membrane protein
VFRLLDRACALGCLAVIGFCLLGLLAAFLASMQPSPPWWLLALVFVGLGLMLTTAVSRPR